MAVLTKKRCLVAGWRDMVADDVWRNGRIKADKEDTGANLHLVKAIQCPRFQIGNNRGGINGWIGSNSIYGCLLRVE